ncbi:hypothetical protein F972_02911 [Acinetobacter sp. CIP 102529]|nr:hypothetical protein F972_02956 [Acinetobacter sp. CIP 102529]ENU87808.1 hypothetical protein F972_02911 [Acinetobacter sp. CIP 102529]
MSLFSVVQQKLALEAADLSVGMNKNLCFIYSVNRMNLN